MGFSSGCATVAMNDQLELRNPNFWKPGEAKPKPNVHKKRRPKGERHNERAQKQNSGRHKHGDRGHDFKKKPKHRARISMETGDLPETPKAKKASTGLSGRTQAMRVRTQHSAGCWLSALSARSQWHGMAPVHGTQAYRRGSESRGGGTATKDRGDALGCGSGHQRGLGLRATVCFRRARHLPARRATLTSLWRLGLLALPV